jgi:predicted lactoylglutathione lyase
MDYGRGYTYGVSMDKPTLGIVIPFDKKPATVGNGVMVALGVDSRATVDRVYKKALDLGGADEGQAGPRGEDFYAGYFRDLDGNKLSVFCVG